MAITTNCFSGVRQQPGAIGTILVRLDDPGRPAALRDFDPAYVRFGSGADITRHPANVRFPSESGQRAHGSVCPLSAKSGHWALQHIFLFDHLVGAQSWIVSPIDIAVFNGCVTALRYIRDTRVGAIVT